MRQKTSRPNRHLDRASGRCQNRRRAVLMGLSPALTRPLTLYLGGMVTFLSLLPESGVMALRDGLILIFSAALVLPEARRDRARLTSLLAAACLLLLGIALIQVLRDDGTARRDFVSGVIGLLAGLHLSRALGPSTKAVAKPR